MPELDKVKDKKLIESLIEENYQIAKRHLKKAVDAEVYMNVPFGTIQDRLHEMVDIILANM